MVRCFVVAAFRQSFGPELHGAVLSDDRMGCGTSTSKPTGDTVVFEPAGADKVRDIDSEAQIVDRERQPPTFAHGNSSADPRNDLQAGMPHLRPGTAAEE